MRFEHPLALAALSVSLAACASLSEPPKDVLNNPGPTAADAHRIIVAQAGERLEVPISGGALSPEAAAMIDDFGALYRQYGHGPLLLSTPSGVTNPDAAAQTAQATRLRLVEGGVPFAAIAGGAYEAAGAPSSSVVLTFTRYTAEAPDCPPVWETDLAKNYDNRPPKHFGCFVNANLAAMISDPADLNGPRPSEPRDAARRDVVLEKYRQGGQTHATRSPDERASISDAIK